MQIDDYRLILEEVGKISKLNLEEIDKRKLFSEILQSLLVCTGSEYGFIGEKLISESGVPYLKTHAITNIAWNDDTREFFKKYGETGLEFYNLDTLFGATLISGRTVISNDPSNDNRSGGLPEGHPELRAYAGIPLYVNSEFIGMVGLANRKEGYDEILLSIIEPLFNQCASLIKAHKLTVENSKYETIFSNLRQKLDYEIIKIRKLL